MVKQSPLATQLFNLIYLLFCRIKPDGKKISVDVIEVILKALRAHIDKYDFYVNGLHALGYLAEDNCKTNRKFELLIILCDCLKLSR